MIKDLVNSLFGDFNNLQNGVKILLLALLLTDVAFLILHVFAAFYMRHTDDFDFYLMTRDRSYAEVFQYIKEFKIALFLFMMSLNTKQVLFAILGLLFVYLLADDMMGLHEGAGVYFKETFLSPEAGKLPMVVIQVVFSFLVFIIFAILIWFFIKSGVDSEYELFSKKLMLLVVFLAIFGVGIDFLHSLYNLTDIDSEYVNQILALIEDWGEMLVMTGIVGYVYGVVLINSNVQKKVIN
ncbi:hypothetical protein [Portibacter marinus]|uniref:hypothetical protein n=1 Tax=Portibacter marinus TaxID=2898660 RepID=UPI001F1B19B0|nr:hypothetical protein [Portibacter marinus]